MRPLVGRARPRPPLWCCLLWLPSVASLSPAEARGGECSDALAGELCGVGALGRAAGVQLLQQDARAYSRLVAPAGRAEAAAQPRAVGPAAALQAATAVHGDQPAGSPTGAAASSTTGARTAGASAAAVTTSTTIAPTGITLNAEGDFDAFVSALLTNSATFVVVLSIFMFMRVRYPLTYSSNVLQGTAPSSPDAAQLFSWIPASLSATNQQHIDSIGLDNAMLLEFTNFCMRLCCIIGVPMICLIGPANLIFGGHAAGQDRLSYLSFGNIVKGSDLYWLHAFVTWGVAAAVCYSVHQAQGRFIHLRWAWLRHLAPERANTVLVSGIPEEWQSAEKMRQFFRTMFPGDRIASTYCVRDSAALCILVQHLADAKKGLFEAEALAKKDPANPPTIRMSLLGGSVDAAAHFRSQIAELQPKIKKLRATIKEASKVVGIEGYHCSTGFVTFKARSDAEMCLRLTNISSDLEEWQIDIPPEERDVYWVDLMQDPSAESTRHVIGYALVVALYFAYMPLVIGITNVAEIINMGPLQPVWAGVAPTFGLTFMVSFLPSFIIWIYKLFFTLKAEAWAQHKLQGWYFWFQMVFVVMATSVGQNVRDFTRTLATEPFSIFSILADSLPFATHFYMNYMVLQWVTHAMNLLRYVNWSKFKVLAQIYEEKEAAKKSEPEDQEYYGIGSRSARWTTNMVICLVFGSLCPPMYLLTFVNFAICRLTYGYLIPFAETKKPDLGGVFYVSQLRHVMQGLLVSCALMIGVLYHRAATIGPCIIAAPTLGFVWFAIRRFDKHFGWERLPFHELMTQEEKAEGASKGQRPLAAPYVQPELFDEE